MRRRMFLKSSAVTALAVSTGLPTTGSAQAATAGRPDIAAFLETMAATVTAPISRIATDKFTPGMLLGNGDVGVIVGDETADRQTFRLGRADFWGRKSTDPSWQTTILTAGALTLSSPEATTGDPLSGYRMEQDILRARVTTRLRLGGARVTLRSWTPDAEDALVTEVSSAEGDPDVVLTARVSVPAESAYPYGAGVEDGGLWTTRQDNELTPFRSGCATATRLIDAAFTRTTSGPAEATGTFVLRGGRTVRLVTTLRGYFEVPTGTTTVTALRDAALAAARVRARVVTRDWWPDHLGWWRDFWSRSFVRVHDRTLEEFYYGAQYVLGAATREGAALPPSLWGPWPAGEPTRWGGMYFLNYNTQAPYYGVCSSNRPELITPYEKYVAAENPWQRQRTAQAGYQGICYGRAFTPYDMVRPAPSPTPVAPTKDWKKLPSDQKSNAVFTLLPLIWRWEYTRDVDYLREHVYPPLKEMDVFYRDYAEWDAAGNGGAGRWVIPNSSAHEGAVDLNPNLDLGFARRAAATLVEASEVLGVDAGLRPVWREFIDKLADYPTGTVDGTEVFHIAEEVRYKDPAVPNLLFEPGNQPINMEGTVHPGEMVSVGGDERLLKLARDSLEKMGSWCTAPGGASNNGFPKVWPIAARVGWPAADLVEKFKAGIRYLWRSSNHTCFQGGGGIETSGATEALNSMLLQSESGVIRLFPVWPKERDAAFWTLRAKGAFLVSARRAGGVVREAELHSERGGTVRVADPWGAGAARLTDAHGARVPYTVKDGLLTWRTRPGATYTLKPARPRHRQEP
ncbi:glycoside hydrolase family 95-like protein [Streptomyces sp. NPDC046862]|uniref:glycosyl hydrolase family 95 catalytic domain-containing protein n=1 Tax=Streptomyces sp. NPDC046862 TaxID=3154603 RepID=UPI0034528B4C